MSLGAAKDSRINAGQKVPPKRSEVRPAFGKTGEPRILRRSVCVTAAGATPGSWSRLPRLGAAAASDPQRPDCLSWEKEIHKENELAA